MKFRYNYEKNAKLLLERNISFDEIITYINNGNILARTEHQNQNKYPNQKILHVRIFDPVYSVPYVIEEDGTFFLKTFYPSRKAKKKYLDKQ
ncbi:hypothetical protein [Rickettsia endosymbiont of Halotydeus destructor]|uniref:hypothetical protein n=1 Tax=Rickettsia endosymbiont of Halotydeus destructor TaxID=2996754 RepID=UPI003BAF6987